jgi:hypothetical protein
MHWLLLVLLVALKVVILFLKFIKVMQKHCCLVSVCGEQSHVTLLHVLELLAALAHCHNIPPDGICSHILSIGVKYALELFKLI